MNAQQEQPQYAIIAPQPPAAAVSTALSVASTLAQSLNSSGEYVNMPSSYVTIGMTPPPPSSIQSISTTGNATSTFKTPLLPMPTLEDIEAAAQPSLIATSGGSLLLKYPTNNSRTSLIPLGMGATDLGPPPLEPVSNLSSSSNMTLININNTNIDGGSKLPATSTTVNSSHDNYTAPSGNATVPMTVTNSSRNTSRSNLNYKPASTKCCACFGSSSKRQHKPANMHPTKNILSTKSTTSHPKNTPYKRRSKHNTQTIWSAVLTNMGICALLLAYTLLGSFIFLTIESEDSQLVQQQRTLASTKRGVAWGYRGSDPTNIHNIYHHNVQQQQQQQQQQNQLKQHFDNGTLVNAATSSSSSLSSNTSTLPLQQSSLPSSASSSSMLEGIYSVNGNSNNNNNNNNNNNEFVYGDDAAPQYALSPDTYDVRQRTIENIWDITVSLNILYKENWTKLAALEITKFQDQLIKRLNEDALLQLPSEADVNSNSPATEAVLLYHQHAGLAHHLHHSHFYHEWNFAKAFFYSLTVITTIGYGNIAPRTTLGRLVTLAYAFFGIPLTLVYLSSTGGILAKVAREVFSKALCCCLCSNCGYCCYDEKRMADKERRMKRKRQEEELRKKQAAMQEPYYVRSGSMSDAYRTPEKQSLGNSSVHVPDLDSLSASESRGSMHGLAILAPILLCFSMMIIYILFGALVLYRLEEWPLLDGIYFCFMSLSTIGFGDMMPGFRRDSTTTIWFCSIYIMSGMALTAMCFNVIHEEIVNRIKIVVEFKKNTTLDTNNDDSGYYMPP